jgi:N-acetylglucosaminyl-diphospho-decaprenol L-rhamnosyltransferase
MADSKEAPARSGPTPGGEPAPDPGPDAVPRRDAVDATAIIVNYNSGGFLGPLLERLLPDVRDVVVVDNGSVDGSLALAEGRDRVQVVRIGRNLGFAAAVNRGAPLATAPWLLLVNPDIHLKPGDVAALLGSVPADVAAVAPLQVDATGRPLPETGGYDPTISRFLVWALLPTRYHGRWGPWLAPPFPDRDAELDWVSGALLGIRREVFEWFGGFDERFFLYHEDVDFGRRARQAGYRILCRPSVRLHHEVAHGDPSRRILAGRRAIESLSLDFDGWRLRALGAVLGLGYGLRAAVGRGTTRKHAAGVLGHCVELMRGRRPTRAAEAEGSGRSGR